MIKQAQKRVYVFWLGCGVLLFGLGVAALSYVYWPLSVLQITGIIAGMLPGAWLSSHELRRLE